MKILTTIIAITLIMMPTVTNCEAQEQIESIEVQLDYRPIGEGYELYKTSSPDTMRLHPLQHAVFGDSMDIMILPWNPPGALVPHPFGPVGTLNILILDPDTLSISLLSESNDEKRLLYKGYVPEGDYRIGFIVSGESRKTRGILEVLVGSEKKLISHGSWINFEDVEWRKSLKK